MVVLDTSFNIPKLKVFVNNKDFFEARNINIFTNYVLTFYSAELIDKWMAKCDMSFYQNQLNFAVWCATAGCGISVEHLNSSENLLASVFRFHVYYQTRKVLEEMACPLPGEQVFDATNNHINLVKFQKLCNEFQVQSTDFRFKGGDNDGLGTMFNYWTNLGYRPLKGARYDPRRYKFTEQSGDGFFKIDYVYQEAATEGWKQFIPTKSEGFTVPGIVRLDDSIRNYVHCILGAQAQTRSSILKSYETQQFFVDLLEQNIKSMFSIPESIAKYQEAITKTNVKIDYVIAVGLYMIPSNLVLKIGQLEGYNNSILIATSEMKIGQNEQVNAPKKITPTQRATVISPMYVTFAISVAVLLGFYVFSK